MLEKLYNGEFKEVKIVLNSLFYIKKSQFFVRTIKTYEDTVGGKWQFKNLRIDTGFK